MDLTIETPENRDVIAINPQRIQFTNAIIVLMLPGPLVKNSNLKPDQGI